MQHSSITLSDVDLRSTPCREAVLAQFKAQQHALSQGEIETILSQQFDRVTIYRTLKTFLGQGLIHKVLDDLGGTKYALCKEWCHEGGHAHAHDHVHFKCQTCGQTTCLEDVHIPSLTLPNNYLKIESNLLIQGICAGCRG